MSTPPNYQEQLKELLEHPVSRDNPDGRLAYLNSLATCYNQLHRYKEKLACRREALSIETSPTTLNNLAVAYENNRMYRDVLRLYRSALESEAPSETSSIIYGNMLRYVSIHKTFVSAQRIRLLPRLYTGDLETIIEFSKACLDEDHISAFSLTDGLTISEHCSDYDKHPIVKMIFDATASLREKSQIRLFLTGLYANALAIKEGHRADLHVSALEIGHYTRTENLKSLLKRDEDTFQRLFNVAYMNDPSEGKVFSRLLAQYGIQSRRDTDPVCLRQGHKCLTYGYSTTYIGSFSSSIDSLPMWSQYGNGGRGCCLVFDNDFFDEDEPLTLRPSLEKISEEDATNTDSPPPPERYVLYKVSYISDVSKYPYWKNLQTIGLLYGELEQIIVNAKVSTANMLNSFVENILDQIRFLYKEPDYAHEQEYRVIKWSDTPLCDEGDRSGEIPHLYINMERPLAYKEVILGPKSENPSAIAPYLHFTQKVGQIIKSSIQYQ